MFVVLRYVALYCHSHRASQCASTYSCCRNVVVWIIKLSTIVFLFRPSCSQHVNPLVPLGLLAESYQCNTKQISCLIFQHHCENIVYISSFLKFFEIICLTCQRVRLCDWSILRTCDQYQGFQLLNSSCTGLL